MATPAGAKRSRPYQYAARYYWARPPYSADLLSTLSARLGWDGTGRLLDVGCGPGVIALQLASAFAEVVGLDPEPAMLAEASAATPEELNPKIRWIEGRAEDIPSLKLGLFQSATLAQSFHWTNKLAVAEIIFESLSPGGAMILIHHDEPAFEGGGPASFPSPAPPHPPIPHDVIDAKLVKWLGRGRSQRDPNREPYSQLLARTRFESIDEILVPGRRDLIRSVDEVIDNYLSTSFAAPDLFGDELDAFRTELAAELASRTPTGYFWEWPGDTAVLIARKRLHQ